MIAPTPGGSTGEVSGTSAPAAVEQEGRTQASPRPLPESVIPNWGSPENRARAFLEKLGRGDHPDYEADPISALYQVAIDYRCSAHGYRELYLHHMRHAQRS